MLSRHAVQRGTHQAVAGRGPQDREDRRRHCAGGRADQHAGGQRRGGSRARRRSGPRLCRGLQRHPRRWPAKPPRTWSTPRTPCAASSTRWWRCAPTSSRRSAQPMPRSATTAPCRTAWKRSSKMCSRWWRQQVHSRRGAGHPGGGVGDGQGGAADRHRGRRSQRGVTRGRHRRHAAVAGRGRSGGRHRGNRLAGSMNCSRRGRSRVTPSPVATTRRFLTFQVDAQRYALRAEEVTEVGACAGAGARTAGPPALIGVANLRGTVLPVASLHVMLGSAPRQSAGRAPSCSTWARPWPSWWMPLPRWNHPTPRRSKARRRTPAAPARRNCWARLPLPARSRWRASWTSGRCSMRPSPGVFGPRRRRIRAMPASAPAARRMRQAPRKCW